jgi:mannose-1-phosphate guanylyltransferase
MFDRGPRLWAVILAGGEGAGLAPLVRALHGTDLPGQLAAIVGARSMLQITIDRILPLVPPERILVTVSRRHELLARQQLGEWSPELTLLVQPGNLGTAGSAFLPLARIRERDHAARAVVLPADHYLSRPDALLSTIELADAATHLERGAISVLGAEPDSADFDYDWIIPGQLRGRFGSWSVKRHVETPDPELALELRQQGGLWNTVITVGWIEALWRLCRDALPEHADRMASCRTARELEEACAGLRPASFRREVVEQARELCLLPLRGTRWSEWRTPLRVLESLEGTPDHRQLLRRMAEACAVGSRDDLPERGAAGTMDRLALV